MRLFDAVTSQRRVIYVAVAVLSAAGVWRAWTLPSAIYPELTFPRITVVAEGTSLGAQQQAISVTRPIEEAISTVQGVTRVQSRSIRGGTEISMTFAPNADMAFALQQTQARVNQVQGQLPSGVSIEVERLTPSLFPILSYNLEGGVDPATLYDIARYQIQPQFSRAPGVGHVDVQGTDTHEIEVVADPARLAEQGLTYADLAAAIQQAIAVAAVGRVSKDYKQYLVVTDQEAHSVGDVANVVLPSGLHVRDVATVSLGTEDHVRLIAGDGLPAALINVTRQVGGNTVQLADSIAAIAQSIQRTLPAGVVLKPVYDQAALVRDAVGSVRDAMLIGAVLAVVILFAFLQQGLVTAVSATAIPLTMAITTFVMSLVGQTFNLMTLGAMAIATGLVIDDAVVVTENIVRHLGMSTDRHRAISDAIHELLWPVTTSTLTTVVVFLPLVLLTGVVGQFFSALSITLTIAVLVSLVLAVSVIPLLSERLVTAATVQQLEAGPRRRGLLGAIAHGINTLGDRYERSLDSALQHPWRLIGGAGALLILGYVTYRHIGTGFLPDMDEGAFVLDYYTPGGTALSETDRQLHIVEGILKHTPEIAATSRRTGAELGLFATEQNRGDLVARLRPRSSRSRDIFDVINAVRDTLQVAVPQLHVEFVQILSDVINDLAGASRPVEVKLFGANLDTLEAYATRLSPAMEKVSGLEDLANGVSEPSAELFLHVEPGAASRLGMTPAQVGDAVSGALLGVPAGAIRENDRTVNIRVRAPDAVRNDADRLTQLPVLRSAPEQSTILGTVATVRAVDSRSQYTRENQQQLITMTADVNGRALGDVVNDIRSVLAKFPPPHGVRIELGGQYASQQDAFRSLVLVFVLAVLCVMLVMLVQFRSFVEPVVVLLAAPVSFLGGLILLYVTGTPLNVSSSMGCILLVGLIVKNGIILLDFTRVRMETEGVPLVTALREAGHARLRPILMTTLCTLFGLLPLALGLGAGSELQRPLALMTIGGLALSTPVTLYVVPALLVAVRGGTRRGA